MRRVSEAAALLGIEHSIIQGPFGGGISTTRLAATVSNAGGLGSYGAHLLKPEEIESLCREMRSLTDRPFAINLWVSDADPAFEELDEAGFAEGRSRYNELYEKLGAEPPAWPQPSPAVFERQLEAVLRARPKAFSFVFGIPPREALEECRRAGIVTIGAATSSEEAEAVEAAGVDIVVASGFEAGGHRPSFLRRAEDSLVGSLSLIAAVRERVKIPVVAAGGISNGRSARAAFALGADAIQVGTAFLACAESGADPAHKDRLIVEREGRTVLSRAFTGRLARYLPNGFIERFEREGAVSLPYPAQSWLAGPIKRAAAAASDLENMALYAGQGVGLVRHRRAADVMNELVAAIGG